MCISCHIDSCVTPVTCAAVSDALRRKVPPPPSIVVPFICKSCRTRSWGSWPIAARSVQVVCPCGRSRRVQRVKLSQSWQRILSQLAGTV